MREFTIDSRDMKTKLACYEWEPKSDAKAILVLAHGMQEYLLRYTEMAEYMVSQGIIFAGLDHLGHGKSAVNKDDFGYFCEQDPATVLVRDLHRLKKTVQAEHPGLPVYVMGHSMGSFIVRNYIERYGTGVQGVIIQGGNASPKRQGIGGKLLTSFIALFHGWRYRSMLCTEVVLGPYVKAFPDDPTGWLTKRMEVRDKYQNDEYCNFMFTLNGYYTLAELVLRAGNKKLIANIPKDLPMFIVSGAEDPVGEMGRGVQRMYELYKACGIKKVKLDIRPDDRHELHNEEDRYQVFEEIKDFIL
ncbi:MAG: alpha/beta fold hydrolase [Lachnospiraceae bacterium]|nr:alpha/beta fold hydrolase [Lachnospiraceae bacterium]